MARNINVDSERPGVEINNLAPGSRPSPGAARAPRIPGWS